MQLVLIILCGVVIRLECLDVPSDSVVVDTDVKWMPRLYMSQGIDKVTCVFQFAFIGIFGLDFIQFHLRCHFVIENWYCSLISYNITTVVIL